MIDSLLRVWSARPIQRSVRLCIPAHAGNPDTTLISVTAPMLVGWSKGGIYVVFSVAKPSVARLSFFFAGPARTRFVEPLSPGMAGSALAALAGVTDCWSKKKGVAIEDLSLSCWPRAGVNDVINIPSP